MTATNMDARLAAARRRLGRAADRLAAAARDPRVSPDALAKTEQRVRDAFATYSGLMLLARSEVYQRRTA